MLYRLIGFLEDGPVRRFLFKTGAGVACTSITVVADLARVREFGIPLQELPSVCSQVLESRPIERPAQTVYVTDAHLATRAAENRATEDEAQNKRALRSRQCALAAVARTEQNRSLARLH